MLFKINSASPPIKKQATAGKHRFVNFHVCMRSRLRVKVNLSPLLYTQCELLEARLIDPAFLIRPMVRSEESNLQLQYLSLEV